MHQFINGSDAAFADLEDRARSACVVFYDQELPPGSTPARARIGFEVNPVNGSAVFLVHRPVTYRGLNDDIRTLLQAGEKRFNDFAGLIRWIRGPLAACYRNGSHPGPQQPVTSTGSARLRPADPDLAATAKRAAVYALVFTAVTAVAGPVAGAGATILVGGGVGGGGVC
jgi:hypothetical protein